MENNKCFNKKATYFIAGALVITIFGFIDIIINFSENDYLYH